MTVSLSARRRRAQWRTLVATIAAVAGATCGGSVTEVGPEGPAVAEVVISPSTATIILGATQPFQAAVRDASGAALTDPSVVWSVKDTDVVAVSATGLVTARAVGSTQVAASANGKSGIATITVQRPPVASIAVQPVAVSLVSGKSASFITTVKDVNGAVVTDRTVVWSSSDSAVAGVSGDGVVTAGAVGSATITATSEAKEGSASVTVAAGPVADIGITPSSTSLKSGATVQLVATPRDAYGNGIGGAELVWHSSDSGIATVTSGGLVRTIRSGTVTITASWQGKTGSASIHVTR
ncbi:MAG: Ig domain-containing protein [Gemmatimonadales bacterium]